MSDERTSAAVSIGRRLGHEMLEYALLSAYLYVCFGALLLYKTAILHGNGISYSPYGIAAIKAVILGKFILIGHAARVGDRYKKRRFVQIVAYKALFFLVLLLLLSIIEEMIVGYIHGRTLAESLADVAGPTLPVVLANCLVMLLILIPYLAFRELSEVLGPGRLRQILLEHRVGSHSSHR